MKKVGPGIAVFVLVLIGGLVLNQRGDAATAARVGDCARR